MGCSGTLLRVKGLSLFLCIYSLILQTSPWYTWFVPNLHAIGVVFHLWKYLHCATWRLHEKHHLYTENFIYCHWKQSQGTKIKTKIVQWLRCTFWTAFRHQDDLGEWTLIARTICTQIIQITLLFLSYLLWKMAIIIANFDI